MQPRTSRPPWASVRYLGFAALLACTLLFLLRSQSVPLFEAAGDEEDGDLRPTNPLDFLPGGRASENILPQGSEWDTLRKQAVTNWEKTSLGGQQASIKTPSHDNLGYVKVDDEWATSTSTLVISPDEANSGVHRPLTSFDPQNITTTLVVGRLHEHAEEVQWIHDYLEDITHKRIYIVDDPTAPLHLNKNKGREAMVYLRYIIDFYDELDDVTLFFHFSRSAWHNNVLFNRDAAIMINNLRRDYVLEIGYMNARCELYPGCSNPGWIKFNPTREQDEEYVTRNQNLFTSKLWDEIFPNRQEDPNYLSQPCCSQFAVSREMIRSVPMDEYKRIHDWLATTGELDAYTGRIMEYTWQYLFLGQERSCPSMRECYCKGYGTCLIDDADLIEYNNLRIQVDETLTKLAAVNEHRGCTELEDEEARNKCREHNPYEEPLHRLRTRTGAYEQALPLRYGMTDPKGLSPG